MAVDVKKPEETNPEETNLEETKTKENNPEKEGIKIVSYSI